MLGDAPAAGATYVFKTFSEALESEPVQLHASFSVTHEALTVAVFRNGSGAELQLLVVGMTGFGGVVGISVK